MDLLKIPSLALLFASLPLASLAGPATFQLTVVNGSQTSLSAGVIYVSRAGKPLSGVGVPSTKGYIDICKSGNPTVRVQELTNHPDVSAVKRTAGGIAPGTAATFEIEVTDVNQQVIHYETMYGATKDVCGKITLGPPALHALFKNITPAVAGRDDALVTGAYETPLLPTSGKACAGQADALSCLRSLSLARASTTPKGEFFAPYSVGVLAFLEGKYGAAATRPLIFAPNGAIAYRLTLKP